MSYLEAKLARDRALVESLHEGGETVRGLPPIASTFRPDAAVRRVLQPPPSPEPREIGWGQGIVIEDGARLIFGDLGDDR